MPSSVIESRETISNGLRPESFVARDMPFLTKCLNRRVTKQGLKNFYAITQPISDNYITTTLGETKAWPMPQLIRGRAVTLLCFPDAIYSVDESSYLCTLLDTRDAGDITGGTSKAITTGKDWHFADFRGAWMLFNGACVVFKTMRSGTVWVQDAVGVNTGFVHKEARLLMGGFSNYNATVDWASYWRERAEDMPGEFENIADTQPGLNWVSWSSILAPDMHKLFMEQPALYGSFEDTPTTGFTDARPLILDLLERNDSGMRPMPWQGRVAGFLPLGEGVVCYGEDGVSYMASFSATNIHTYAVHGLVGLASGGGVLVGTDARTAFAGDKSVNAFIEPGGNICLVESNLNIRRLGYSEYISGMNQNKILMDYDPIHKEFYISDGSISYMLTESGLCRCPYTTSKMHAFSASELSGIRFASSDPTTMEVQSGTYTSPSGRVETITAVEIIGLNASTNGMVLKIKSRFNQTDEFYESASLTLDGRTRAVLAIPFTQFRWVLTSPVATNVTVENVRVEISSDVFGGIDAILAASSPSAATE